MSKKKFFTYIPHQKNKNNKIIHEFSLNLSNTIENHYNMVENFLNKVMLINHDFVIKNEKIDENTIKLTIIIYYDNSRRKYIKFLLLIKKDEKYIEYSPIFFNEVKLKKEILFINEEIDFSLDELENFFYIIINEI